MFEQRPYFVFGDVVSNAAAGALASVTMAAVVDVGWVMPVAMGVGMGHGRPRGHAACRSVLRHCSARWKS